MIRALPLLAAAGMLLAAPPAEQRMLRLPVRLSTDAAPSRWSVLLDGKDARVASILTPGDAQMLLVVLDLTGDIAQVDPAKQAIAEQLRALAPSTHVALLRAQDGLHVLLDPTADREALGKAVADVNVTGRPGLIEVLENVQALADSVAAKSRVRVSVVYVTDSDVQWYREDFTNPVINSSDPHDLSRRFPEQLIQEKISKLDTSLAKRQSAMHIVHLTYRGDRLNEAYQNGLRRLADASAGTITVCRTSAEIPEAIARAFSAAAREYHLIVALPERRPDRAQIQVTATGADGQELPAVYKARISLKEK